MPPKSNLYGSKRPWRLGAFLKGVIRSKPLEESRAAMGPDTRVSTGHPTLYQPPTVAQSVSAVVETNYGERITPQACWERALSELTTEKRQALDRFGIMHHASLSVSIERLQELKDGCTNELSMGRGGKMIIPQGRIHNILKKIEKYAKIGDIAIQHHPEVTSLVWAGLRFCLQVALNDMQTFEGVSSALEEITDIIVPCTIYERIHSPQASKLESSAEIIKQLIRLYIVFLNLMVDAIEYFQRPGIERVARGITNPFETTFKPLIDEIKTRKEELDSRAILASNQLHHVMNESQRVEFRKLRHHLDGHFASLSSGLETTKRREVLLWISEVTVENQHFQAKKHRFDSTGKPHFDSTGQWLFQTPQVNNWIDTDSSSILWLHGKAGSGKTVLSSLIVDTLTETYKSTPTLYFYCNYAEPTRREALSIVRSLLKQLSAKDKELDPTIISAFDDATSLSLDASKDLLKTAISRFEDVYIIVDALDECLETESEKERELLVEFLAQLSSFEGCNVKMFLTSRFDNDLHQMLKDNHSYQINADDTTKDIQPFIAARIDDLVRREKLLRGGIVTPKLREELIMTLSRGADGMFLWATYQLELISKQGTEEEVRAQLGKLPRGLNGTYNRIWGKIMGSDSGCDDTESKWALKTLALLLYALKPLSPGEILEATATDQEVTFDRKKMASSLGYLIGVCGGFVVLDEESNVLRFMHYSVKQYLEQRPELKEDPVAEACFVMLGSPMSSLPPKNAFYGYAVWYWSHHARSWKEISDRHATLIRNFLLNPSRLREWRSHVNSSDFFEEFKIPGDDAKFTPDQVASYFNLHLIVEHLLQHSSQNENYSLEISRSLHIASSQGNIEIARLLLQYKADVNARGGRYETMLQAAATGGSVDLVELLLECGADVNARGGKYGTALQVAAGLGNARIVKRLLEASANINSRGGKYGTALDAAAAKGVRTGFPWEIQTGTRARPGQYKEVVRLLLESKADPNAQVGERSALWAAVETGDDTIVDLLLKANADPNSGARPRDNQTPLQIASARGYGEIVQLLLNARADFDAQLEKQGGQYRTALQAAVMNGHQHIAELLVEVGADVNAQGGEGGTALQAAVARGDEKTVDLLLDAKADFTAVGEFCTTSGSERKVYTTVLQAAANTGLEKVVQVLLAAGVDINAQSGDYGTALQIAAMVGHVKIVEMLLIANANVLIQGGVYGTALEMAAMTGKEKVVELLLTTNPDIDTGLVRIGTPLRAAAGRGDERIVEMLLKAGADVNATSLRGQGTALQAAVLNGNERIVRLLTNANVNVNFADGRNHIPLVLAAARGDEVIVELLLRSGADINARRNNVTALDAAVTGGYLRVVRILLNASADVKAGGDDGTTLCTTVAMGDAQMLDLLIKAGADVNAGDGAPLQEAAVTGNEEMVQQLLDAGAEVNSSNGWGRTALQAAAVGGNAKIVDLLLKAKADPNVVREFESWFDSRGCGYLTQDTSALQAAARRGFEEVVGLLLSSGADANAPGGDSGTALEGAVVGGHLGVVELLLKAKANPNPNRGHWFSAMHTINTPKLSSNRPMVYKTTLQAAAFKGFGKIVQLLLNAGAKTNARGGLALWTAARQGHEIVVEQLLKAKASANTGGGRYGTALQVAAAGGHDGVVELLLKANADINSGGGKYGTALQAAAERNQYHVVQQLLEANAGVNIEGGKFGTALQAAAVRGHGYIVKLLLRANTDVNAMGGRYGTALQGAVVKGYESIINLLLGAGADVNAVGGKYGTALQAAAASGCEQIARLLLSAGAEINTVGGKHGTVYRAAVTSGNEDMVELLRDWGATGESRILSTKSGGKTAWEDGEWTDIELMGGDTDSSDSDLGWPSGSADYPRGGARGTISSHYPGPILLLA